MDSKHYGRDAAVHRAGINANDAITITSILTGGGAAVPPFVCGRENLQLHARFSAALQQVTVAIVATWINPADGTELLLGISDPLTLQATAYTDGAGKFLSSLVTMPAFGGRNIRLLVVTKPVSGTCDLWLASN